MDAFIEGCRSSADGHYLEVPPAADLRSHVACGWIKVIAGSVHHQVVPIIPDGCADLMTYDDGPPFVVGPDASTRFVSLAEVLVITGLRLRPGALRSVLGCPAKQLVGQSVLLSDLSADARSLRGRLDQATTFIERIARLEDWVRSRIDADRDAALLRACRLLSSTPCLGMDVLAEELGWNARMLHRAFVASCGYGPKHLQRILRVQTVIRRAQGPHRPRLSSIAASLGFADQAHMTRDFRDLTGFSPSAYLNQASVGVGRWIEEAWETPADGGRAAHLSDPFKTPPSGRRIT